jgi:hypothetical protein
MSKTEDKHDRGQSGKPGSNRWVETAVLWGLIGLGGVGLWLSTADPIFGGADMASAAVTMFAFFIALGVAATLLIWCWPSFWQRWVKQVPPGENVRLEIGLACSHVSYLAAGIFMVCWIVKTGMGPVPAGAFAGSLMVLCLVTDLCLHHWLGRR